jgi:hypothetical protein
MFSATASRRFRRLLEKSKSLNTKDWPQVNITCPKKGVLCIIIYIYIYIIYIDMYIYIYIYIHVNTYIYI